MTAPQLLELRAESLATSRATGGIRRRIAMWWPVAVIAIYVFAAAFPFVLAPHAPDATNFAARLQGPGTIGGTHFWLGADDLGRDVLSRVIWGARVSLLVAGATVLVAGVVGGSIGVLAALERRFVGAVLMRIADMVLSVPFFLLAILVAIVLGPSVINVVIVLAVARWPRYARVAFGQTLDSMNRDSFHAAVALGARRLRLIRRYVLPEILPAITVVATLEVGLMVVFEASLSFVGVGAQPPTPDWGGMLAEGQQYIATAWWISTFPGLALFLFVLAVNKVGDRVRDLLDPRMRAVRR